MATRSASGKIFSLVFVAVAMMLCLHLREIPQGLVGDLSSYLPHRDGRVVCGCFRPDLNPDAPDVILPGRGPKVERWARVFATQPDFIPCFVKADTNAWEYVGRFCVR